MTAPSAKASEGLVKLYMIQRPDGTLVPRVPSSSEFGSWFDLIGSNRDSLRREMELAGFRCVEVEVSIKKGAVHD